MGSKGLLCSIRGGWPSEKFRRGSDRGKRNKKGKEKKRKRDGQRESGKKEEKKSEKETTMTMREKKEREGEGEREREREKERERGVKDLRVKEADRRVRSPERIIELLLQL